MACSRCPRLSPRSQHNADMEMTAVLLTGFLSTPMFYPPKYKGLLGPSQHIYSLSGRYFLFTGTHPMPECSQLLSDPPAQPYLSALAQHVALRLSHLIYPTYLPLLPLASGSSCSHPPAMAHHPSSTAATNGSARRYVQVLLPRHDHPPVPETEVTTWFYSGRCLS